ncbi:MAG TPA: ABC transporter ATP-binding protein, partial [Candidatus Tectomicrobia bacterium]|nr:ABC transporter ATP-binding protein [Candidatus Tectomicrobia bacterium]
MSAIELDGLTKDYPAGFLERRRVRALDGLSLTVQPGEVFGLLGGNGAGKTTTIKLLTGLIFPTAGRARLLGHEVGDLAVRARIGFLPEQPYFYEYLTARELLEYCAQLFGHGPAERRRRAAATLEQVFLEPHAWTQPLRRLSKGMLQRVGLAQALVNDPELVVLDEPMSGLDPIGRRQVRDLIAGLRARGVTVLFSSHIIADIEVLCDRVAILQSGRLAHLGALDELRERVDSRGRLEITLAGASVEALREALALKVEGARVTPSPRGARVEVASERDVDAVLACARQSGARLVAVQPLRQSLEDLFG